MFQGLLMLQAAKPRTLVSLKGIGKTFATGREALRGVDLEIRAGEFVSLLGPSGCGKSTILRLIAGLETPSSGILLRGFDDVGAAIGFVFQDPTLMPWASVFDNVFLPLRLRGQSRALAEPAVRDALALVGLSGSGEALPRELSGGMRMRVSIARALVLRPLLLLMDEPFAALDEMTRARLNDDLLRLQGELGATIVFVTHSVFESVYLSSRIAVMAANPGRIVAEIEPSGGAGVKRDERFRLSAAYARCCETVSGALRGAMAGDAPL